MGLRNTDKFLVNRGTQSYKLNASEIGDYLLTVPPNSSKPNEFVINDGALRLKSADGSIIKEKFTANQSGNSELTFSDGITINNQGDIVLDPDWFASNTPGVNDGELRVVEEGTGIVHKLFSANQKGNTKLKFKGASVNIDGSGNITVDTDSVKSVTLWGQNHDHTGNVSGDMTKVKSITGANAPLNIKASDGNDNWDLTLHCNREGSNVIIGSDGAVGRGGHIKFYQGADDDGFRFYPKNGLGYGNLNFTNITNSNNYRFPDKSGNVALLNDINSGWLIFKQGVAEVARYRASRLNTQAGDDGSNVVVNLPTGGGGGGGAATPVELWGQLHDHTGNVKGDMINVDSITGGNTSLIIKSKGSYDAHFHSGNNGTTKLGTHTNGNLEFFTKGVNGYKFFVPGSTTINANFNFTNLTADRNFKWQDTAGTVALTKDIGNGVVTFKDSNGNEIGKVDVNASSNSTINIPTTSGGGGGASNSDGSINVSPGPGGTSEVSVNQVKLWGQNHDHTGNVSGTITGANNVYGANDKMEVRPKDSTSNRNLLLSGNTNTNTGAGGSVIIGDANKGTISFKTGTNAGYQFYKEKDSSIIGKLNFQQLNGTHTFKFQNKNGTLAHLDDIKDGTLVIETTTGTVLGTFSANATGTTRIQVPAGGGGSGGGDPALVSLWGQPHDHNSDVSGDMTGVKSITGANASLIIKSKDGNGNHDLKLEGNAQGSNVIIGNGSTTGNIQFYSGSATGFRFFNSKRQRSILNFEDSNGRTFTFQNKAGTLAHLDDISNETITIDVNGDKQSFTLNGSSKTLSFTVSGGGTPAVNYWNEVTNSDGTVYLRPNSGGYIAVAPRNNTTDLGLPDKRWANVYTNDLHLSNEGKTNDVDGTSGDWTIQEGDTNLYIINNKTGDKFKFLLEKVN